jgi:hypothetical protein
MAGSSLSRWAKVVVTHLTELAETEILGIPDHLGNDFCDATHLIVSIKILLIKKMGITL